MAFKAGFNNIVVSLKSKSIGNFTDIWRAANMNPSSQLNHADLVQIIGTVVSVPCAVTTNMRDHEGFSIDHIEVGDKVFFRYDVVFDLIEDLTSEVPIYRNRVGYIDKEYWLVDITKLFAVIRGEEVIMLNGYVLLEDMGEKRMIVLPEHLSHIDATSSATVSAIGYPLGNEKPIDVQNGDKVYFNHRRVQEYTISDKKFGVTRQQDILGKVVATVNT
jgi:co-chaperonin GroES (HSP10)